MRKARILTDLGKEELPTEKVLEEAASGKKAKPNTFWGLDLLSLGPFLT
jgi:hypothetical protein